MDCFSMVGSGSGLFYGRNRTRVFLENWIRNLSIRIRNPGSSSSDFFQFLCFKHNLEKEGIQGHKETSRHKEEDSAKTGPLTAKLACIT